MFCPNCGKDCADANFCSMCGTRIRAVETTDTATVVGMPFSQTDTQEDSYEFPIGSYASSFVSFLDLASTFLLITRKLLFNKTETTISYDQLYKVMLVRPRKEEPASGYLLFRCEGNKGIPMPEIAKLRQDKTTLIVQAKKMDLFYHIFCVLRTVAPASAEFSIVTPSMTEERLEKLRAEVDMDACFERFSPYRDRAVKYICQAVHLQTEEARNVVDAVFDARQAEVYTENPKLAIRDLNKIIADEERKAAEEERESETRARMRAYRHI